MGNNFSNFHIFEYKNILPMKNCKFHYLLNMLKVVPVTLSYLQLITLQANVFRCPVLFLLAVSAKNSTRTSFVYRSVLQ